MNRLVHSDGQLCCDGKPDMIVSCGPRIPLGPSRPSERETEGSPVCNEPATYRRGVLV